MILTKIFTQIKKDTWLSLVFTIMICVFCRNSIASEGRNDEPLTIEINEEEVLNLLEKTKQESSKNEPKEDNNQSAPKSDKGESIDPLGEGVSILERKQIIESMFLNEKQLEELLKALKFYESGEEGEYLGDGEEEVIEEEVEEEVYEEEKLAANVYLNSILYTSEKNWSVWLNGKKITNETNSENSELYLLNVTKSKVIVLWRVSFSKWEIIVPNQEYLQTVEVNDDNEVENIFSLRPNQTYLPVEDRVIEGKVSEDNQQKPSQSQGVQTIEIPLEVN